MKNLKKILASLLVVAMIASIAAVPVFAASFSYEKEAKDLYDLGLYKGTSTEPGVFTPNLGGRLDRQTGVIMLLRLFGQEEKALELTVEEANASLAKFKDAADIADWAKKQVAYAVDKGFVKGYEDQTFRPAADLNGKAYASLILQQLGYNGDFEYGTAAYFLAEVGGLSDTQAATFNSDAGIIRDGLVGFSYATLQADYKDTGKKVIQALIDGGNVAEDLAKEIGVLIPEIVSVAALEDVTVEIGETPELPAKVIATYDDESTAEVDITWPTVDTSADGEQEIEGTITDTTVKAKIKVIVVPAELTVENVTTDNLVELTVNFNKAVDAELAGDKANYEVKVGSSTKTISNAEVSADNMSVTLLLSAAVAQQDNVDVKVKKEVGLTADVTKTASAVMDTTIPTVVSVVPVGNKLVKVTFSEPVQNAATLGNYTIDGKLFGAANPSLSNNGKVASIVLSTRLTAATHTLSVKNSVTDYAGYKLAPNSTEFAVAEDTSAPTVSLVSATQTELKVKFSEEVTDVTAANVTTASSTTKDTSFGTNGVKLEEDNMTFTVKFTIGGSLPTLGTKVTFKDVMDYSGNKATLELDVTPNYDTERPTYVGYEVKDQNKIVVEFSEEVLTTEGSYVLKNSDGDAVTLSSPVHFVNDDGDTVKSKVQLSKSSGTFDAGSYTLEIKDVVDNNPLKNKILSVNVSISVADQTAPIVESVTVDSTNNKLFVKFNEEVDSATATTKTNYTYISSNISKALNADTTVTLLSDNKTVAIAFPAEAGDNQVLVANVDVIQVSGVKDTSGNVITTVAISSYTAIGAVPSITAAKITDKNEMVVTLSSAIDVNTVSLDDFVIMAGTTQIQAWDKSFDEDTNELTLTINADISADGKFNGQALTIYTQVADDIGTTNVYGQKLAVIAQGSALSVTDAYAPTATVVTATYGASGTVVKVELSENLDSAEAGFQTALNNLIVMVDGSAKAFSAVYTNAVADDTNTTTVDETAPAMVTITLTDSATDYKDKAAVVKYFAPVTPVLKDALDNALANIDMTDTVEAE